MVQADLEREKQRALALDTNVTELSASVQQHAQRLEESQRVGGCFVFSCQADRLADRVTVRQTDRQGQTDWRTE